MSQTINNILNINVSHDIAAPIAGVSENVFSVNYILWIGIAVAMVGFVAVVVFLLIRHFRKSSHWLSFAISLVFCVAGITISAFSLGDHSVLADNLTTNFDVLVDAEPEIAYATTTLTLESDFTSGYKVYAYFNGDGTLYNSAHTASIAPTANLELDAESYGLTFLDDDGEFAGYTALSSDSDNPTLLYSSTSSTAINSTIEIEFAANLSTATPIGTYSGEIIFTIEPYTLADITTMQEASSIPNLCANTPTPTAYGSEITYTLTDSRDNKTYTVAKLLDGNCWMTQNLALGSNEHTTLLTSADSDVSTDFVLPVSVSWEGADAGWNDANGLNYYAFADYYPTSQANNKYGNYYSWYTATAGTGTEEMYDEDASSSICPKGWRLPSEETDDFYNLMSAYGWTEDEATIDLSRLSSSPLSLPFAGYYYTSGLADQGSYIRLWSSSATGNSSQVYDLNIDYDGFGNIPYNDSKDYGQSVRCLMR